MSTTIEDGGPAFPCPSHHEDPVGSWPKGFGGMSLRDWFAGQALPQICAGNVIVAMNGGTASDEAGMARDSYKLADAMIAERSKAAK